MTGLRVPIQIAMRRARVYRTHAYAAMEQAGAISVFDKP